MISSLLMIVCQHHNRVFHLRFHDVEIKQIFWTVHRHLDRFVHTTDSLRNNVMTHCGKICSSLITSLNKSPRFSSSVAARPCVAALRNWNNNLEQTEGNHYFAHRRLCACVDGGLPLECCGDGQSRATRSLLNPWLPITQANDLAPPMSALWSPSVTERNPSLTQSSQEKAKQNQKEIWFVVGMKKMSTAKGR